jgi:hypothetical protein
MVDPHTFLTALYTLVDDLVAGLPGVRHPGPAAALMTSEVVTLALYGQWARFRGERALYRHARRSPRGAGTRLPDRGQYNRQPRRAYDAIAAVGQHLAWLCDAGSCPYEALDSMGMVTRNSKRRGRGWLAGVTQTGWCNRLGFFDRLLSVFGLEHERPHALAGLRARLAAKAALHAFSLWFNVQLWNHHTFSVA